MSHTARPLTALAALLIAALPIAACGDDDSGGSSKSSSAAKSLTITESGSKKDVTLEAPKTAEAGLTEVKFVNNAKEDRSVELVRVTGDHTVDELLKAGSAWGDQGKPLADWITFAGGFGSTKPGATSTAEVALTPGKYFLIDIEAENKKAQSELEVTGDGGGDLPSGDATITAKEYEFSAQDLKTGSQKIQFENAGQEPHHVVAAPLKPGKTVADVAKAIKSQKGAPPIDESAVVDGPIISGGEKQILDLGLKKKGKYVLMCFVPDRAGGPPHVVKGMITETTVG